MLTGIDSTYNMATDHKHKNRSSQSEEAKPKSIEKDKDFHNTWPQDIDHYGDIPPGLVYERIRLTPDPTWEDFSGTALGPVLHSSSTITTTTQRPPTHINIERPIPYSTNHCDIYYHIKCFHDTVQYNVGKVPPELVYEKIRSMADPTWEDFSSTALGPALQHSSTSTTVLKAHQPTQTLRVKLPHIQEIFLVSTKIKSTSMYNIVQYHFGEIPPGLVYDMRRSIADPTWEDFSGMALGPVLHFEYPISCNVTHSKFIVVSSSNSPCCTNFHMQMLCVHTENSICVHYIFEVIQDKERKLLLLSGSYRNGDLIKGKQFCPTWEDFSNRVLRPELELNNYSTNFVQVLKQGWIPDPRQDSVLRCSFINYNWESYTSPGMTLICCSKIAQCINMHTCMYDRYPIVSNSEQYQNRADYHNTFVPMGMASYLAAPLAPFALIGGLISSQESRSRAPMTIWDSAMELIIILMPLLLILLVILFLFTLPLIVFCFMHMHYSKTRYKKYLKRV